MVKKYPDEFKTVKDVFDQLIGRGKKAFVKVGAKVSFEDAIRIIRKAGGISILAHPGIFSKEESIKLIDYFVSRGGNGIETYYPYGKNNDLVAFYQGIAREKKILESGGGDHHDEEKFALGKAKVPDEVLEKLLCFKKNL